MAVSTGGVTDRSMFKSHAPHFFKILFDHTISNKKLGIPKKFVRNYGDNFPDCVLLKVPSGDLWRVELLKCDDEIWFQNGWQEFADFYSLGFGSFLVFQYDQRRCHFNVLIFDTSASEIDYPCRINNGENVVPIGLEEEFVEPRTEQVEDKDDSVEILDGFSSSWKRRPKSPLSSAEPSKKVKLGYTARRFKAKSGNGGMCINEEKFNGVVAQTQQLMGHEKAYALERARAAFKCNNPFFMVVIQPSYIKPGHRLGIPRKFVNKHFNKKCNDVILNGMHGKTWWVKYSFMISSGKASTKFYYGWKQFAHDNNLKVGDVCVFELINGKKNTLKVVIDRNIKGANSCPTSGNSKESKHEKGNGTCNRLNKGTCIKSAKGTTSTNAFCEVKISQSNLKNSPPFVPLTFVAEFMEKSRGNVTLQVKNRCWDVKLIRYPHRAFFSAGWVAFAHANSLQAGDVCNFKLINAEIKLIDVSILRKHLE